MSKKNNNNNNNKKDVHEVESSDELKEQALEPITKSKSQVDKELKEYEVETSAGGIGGSGG